MLKDIIYQQFDNIRSDDMKKKIISILGNIIMMHGISRILKGERKISIPLQIMLGKVMKDHPEKFLSVGQEFYKQALYFINKYYTEEEFRL